MKKAKKTNRPTMRVSGRGAGATAEHKPVALTLKIDREMYQRLLRLRATGEKLRTHQEILRQALQEYLDRAGVGPGLAKDGEEHIALRAAVIVTFLLPIVERAYLGVVSLVRSANPAMPDRKRLMVGYNVIAMNPACVTFVEMFCGLGLFYVFYLSWSLHLRRVLKRSRPTSHAQGSDTEQAAKTEGEYFRMDPLNPKTGDECVGGFEPHMKRYQNLAQLLLTLATATVAFLVHFLVGIGPTSDGQTRGLYSIRLENASRSSIIFLAFSAVSAIFFILWYSVAYEEYCQDRERRTYTLKWYAVNLSLACSCISWFFFAYAFLAWKVLFGHGGRFDFCSWAVARPRTPEGAPP